MLPEAKTCLPRISDVLLPKVGYRTLRLLVAYGAMKKVSRKALIGEGEDQETRVI